LVSLSITFYSYSLYPFEALSSVGPDRKHVDRIWAPYLDDFDILALFSGHVAIQHGSVFVCQYNIEKRPTPQILVAFPSNNDFLSRNFISKMPVFVFPKRFLLFVQTLVFDQRMNLSAANDGVSAVRTTRSLPAVATVTTDDQQSLKAGGQRSCLLKLGWPSGFGGSTSNVLIPGHTQTPVKRFIDSRRSAD
jgi:hypothetical protein